MANSTAAGPATTSHKPSLPTLFLAFLRLGATAMQAAAYVGLKVRGVSGALATYVGFGLPAFVLMVAPSALYMRFRELPAVVPVFLGLRVLVVAIVANAAYIFGCKSLQRWPQAVVALFAAILFAPTPCSSSWPRRCWAC